MGELDRRTFLIGAAGTGSLALERPGCRGDRRTFLIGAAGTVGVVGAGSLLAACGDAGDDPATPILVPTFPDGGRFPSAMVHSVEHRVAYALHDGVDIMRTNAPESIDLEIRAASGTMAAATLPRRDQGVPTPYYSLFFTPPAAGLYTSVLTLGDETSEHEFLVLEPGGTAVPQPGTVLPAFDTATFDDHMGIDPLCTRSDPCPFHTTNLVDALAAADKPTVLNIATPGFCQTAVCGPVIDLLVDAAADRDDLHVVHAEVFVDPHNDDGVATGTAQTTPIVSGYQLPFEPVLFVTDATGMIRRRLDAIWDGSELADALALV